MARIVLIDDHAGLRAVLAEILSEAGHTAVAAASGLEGLDAVRRERPDLVLCDVNMPDLDGFGVLRAIRADPDLASVPFVFLTSEAEVRAGMAAGADDYLLKPVGSAEMLAAVEARLARFEATRREAERRMDEVRRTVTGLLPHEVRTPLTAILGAARLLRDSHAELRPEDVGRMAGWVVEAAERLHRMAENYILYADLEVQRLAGAPGPPPGGPSGPAEVRSAATEVAEGCGRLADLELDLEDVEAPVAGTHLEKVVSELCHNAFAFSAPAAQVRVRLARQGSRVLVEVADQGRGMTADQVREVGAFRQFDRARFEQQGSGVGLALVRRIAEAAGGALEIDSTPARGTTVRVAWPVEAMSRPAPDRGRS